MKACSRFAGMADKPTCDQPVQWILVTKRDGHESFHGFCEEHGREMQRSGLLVGHWYHRVPEDQLEAPQRRGVFASKLVAAADAAAQARAGA